MTNEQLYLALGIPVLFNAVVALALWASLRSNMNQRFDLVNQRFGDMRDLWRAELGRVEGELIQRMDGRQ
jgi:hypothetical protein